MNDNGLAALCILLIGVVLALACLLFGLRAGKRQRLIDNLPTSKTTGVFMGLVELKGTAEAEAPLVSYLAGQPCVYYTWYIEEHWSRLVTETYTDDKGKTQTRTRTESGWTTVADGGGQIPFYLQDDCGIILVQPEGAKIESQTIFDETCSQFDALYYGKGPAGSVTDSDQRRRFTEQSIPLHAPLYVMGRSRERDDIVAPEITDDPNEKLFLISTRSEEQVSAGFRMGFWLLGILGLIFCVAGLVIRLRSMSDERIWPAVAGGISFIMAWVIGWVWMVYNSMVELRQRVRQGWANVDVQLKRRSDLIPNLVQAVKGYSGYEQQLQTELAHLRSQSGATAPGQVGADPQACVQVLMAVTEKYPDLKANNSFMSLQKSLVETEQRIALARTYFNDIATFYNTRLQIIPDRFITALGGMQPQALLVADDFERVPVVVKLAN